MESQRGDGELGRLESDKKMASRQKGIMLASGAPLLMFGITKRGVAGTVAALAGSGLMYEGMTGKLRQLAGRGAKSRKGRATSVEHGQGVKVKVSVTIDRPRDEIYRYWRDFENLARFMNDVESIEVRDDKTSHWKVIGPMEQRLEWDAEIISDVENEMISWRSIGSVDDVRNAGSVWFKPAPGGRGTSVETEINYQPPGGKITALASRMLPKDPKRMARDNLRRFKQLMEIGEIITTEGQPSARREGSSGQPMRPVPLAGRNK
jgi:uncharacterized membrane protein